MKLRIQWIAGLRVWATRHRSVRELWLFGSRAKGTARLRSDVDIAVYLMPPKGKDDWALGQYFALSSEWKRELRSIVRRHVSLEPVVRCPKHDSIVRRRGKRLWSRQPSCNQR
jgi:predicted nucleotidyltransferase